MRTRTIYEFTNKEIKLLKKELPDNPCAKCTERIACCGCPKGREYNIKINPYVDNNIYEIALKIKKYKKTLEKFHNIKEECQKKFEEMPKEIQNMLIEQKLTI